MKHTVIQHEPKNLLLKCFILTFLSGSITTLAGVSLYHKNALLTFLCLIGVYITGETLRYFINKQIRVTTNDQHQRRAGHNDS